MKKLAVIGASYLQEPLIEAAKRRGIETHVFAWAAGDVGERSADHFYPISIVEKEEILETCRRIGIDGVCSIASDLAAITVNYVADCLGLVGNSMECTAVSTNKHLMRRAFEAHGDPSPKSIRVECAADALKADLHYPVIVKPLDRSGSRGITKLQSPEGLEKAIEWAKEQGFEKAALVEEYAEGTEYSCEFVSWDGEHQFLALTRKYTTGAPGFVETGHLQPAPVDDETLGRVKAVVRHALTSLGIRFGASHSELKIAADGTIRLIEIGGRMGGDCIGSDLVRLSTGFDFVNAVIDIALGMRPAETKKYSRAAGVRFIFSGEDLEVLARLEKEHPELVAGKDVRPITAGKVNDSAGRFGYFLMAADSAEKILPWLPEDRE